MKLLELPKSPYWGANLHMGYDEKGNKKFSPRSSKVVRDETRVDEKGRRLDKIEAQAVLEQMQRALLEGLKEETRTISIKRYDELLRELLRSAGISVQSEGPPWEEFSTETIERHCKDLSPASERNYKSKLSGFSKWLETNPKLSSQSRLTDFRLPDIQAFYDWWIDEGGATTTANAALKVVSMIFEAGVVADYLEKNPCKGVKKRDNISESKEPFTLDDLTKICRTLSEYPEEIEFADEWDLAIRFSIFTGARQSDCVNRKWSDFSEDFTVVRFVPQKKERLHRIGKKDMTVTLHLPGHIAQTLKNAREASDSEYMTPNLRPITAGKTGLGARFLRILDLAEIEYTIKKAEGSKGASQRSHTFHSFRHTLKTELREGGVSDAANHFVTGHDDAKVGARYIHEKSASVFRECSPVFALIEEAIS